MINILLIIFVSVINGQSVDLTKGRIVTAYDSTCFCRFGEVVCWGSGEYGQLGRGDTANIYNPYNVTPIDLGDGFVVKQIAAGTYHYCAVSVEGRAKCWGYFLCLIQNNYF